MIKKVMADKREGDLAGKDDGIGIKTIEQQDHEGHVKGSKQAEFNERSAQEQQLREDDNELNKKDARDDMHNTGGV
ncbi:MAG TPA: hypothetical protein VM935_04255 [Chitinophagaceae bacterium]|nr:hypothetical protein [Chitinophagaceae bacterium]